MIVLAEEVKRGALRPGEEMDATVAIAKAERVAAVRDTHSREAKLSSLQDHQRGVVNDGVDQLLLCGPEVCPEDSHSLLLLASIPPQLEEGTEGVRLGCGADGAQCSQFLGVLERYERAGRAHGRRRIRCEREAMIGQRITYRLQLGGRDEDDAAQRSKLTLVVAHGQRAEDLVQTA
jgi:hypothetical protein